MQISASERSSVRSSGSLTAEMSGVYTPSLHTALPIYNTHKELSLHETDYVAPK